RIFAMYTILQERLGGEASAFDEIGVEWIYDVVGSKIRRHPIKLLVERALKTDGRPKATGIGAVPRKRFETIICRPTQLAECPLQRLRVFVDIQRICGDERQPLIGQDAYHFLDHLWQHDIITAAD